MVTLVLQGYNCDAVLYDLEDMSCRTEQVRYNYAYKIREDFYTGYDMADRPVCNTGWSQDDWNIPVYLMSDDLAKVFAAGKKRRENRTFKGSNQRR